MLRQYTGDNSLDRDCGDGRTNNNGTLVACNGGVLNSGNQTRSSAVVVNVTGRARVAPDSNSDGIPDDAANCNL